MPSAHSTGSAARDPDPRIAAHRRDWTARALPARPATVKATQAAGQPRSVCQRPRVQERLALEEPKRQARRAAPDRRVGVLDLAAQAPRQDLLEVDAVDLGAEGHDAEPAEYCGSDQESHD